MSNKTQNDSPVKTASAPKKLLLAGVVGIPLAYILGIIVAAGLMWGFLAINSKTRTQEASQCASNPNLEIKELRAGDVNLVAEVAASGAEQQQGLSDRDCLGDGRAMLFPYGNAGNYCYWMKDMRFAIDMIWLDQDKKVVTIKNDATPDTYPDSFCPEAPAMYVVEVNTGVAKANNWQSGTQFSF